MTKHTAKLNECKDLEAEVRELGAKEIAILDTNILIKAFPWYVPYPGKSKKQEVEIVRWMKNWRSMQTPAVPCIPAVVKEELYHLYGKLRGATMPVKSFLNHLRDSESAFYISLSGEAILPEDIDVDLTVYSKNGNKPNDARILAVAYDLCKNTSLGVTVVSADGDFNPFLQITLGKYCTEDGRYVRLETPEEFTERTGLSCARRIA